MATGNMIKFARRLLILSSLMSFFSGLPSHAQEPAFKHRIKSVASASWKIEVMGHPTANPDRIVGIAQLLAAKHAIKSGYGYFKITFSKKTIKCRVSKEYGTVTGGFALVGNSFFGEKKKKSGFLDAKAFVAKYEKKLLVEPDEAQRKKIASELTNWCLEKREAGGDSFY